MKKIFYSFLLTIGLLISNISFATPPSPCSSTWANSSAAQSCGPTYCRGGGDVIMNYNWETNQCTFTANCCQMGAPCPGDNEGDCGNSHVTVKKGNSNINNCAGVLSIYPCSELQKKK